MLSFLVTIFMLYVLFKCAGFLISLCGTILGGFLGLLGYIFLAFILIGLFGVAIYAFPIILLIGIGVIIGLAVKS
ncbi:MAG: hypothetical protein K5675_00970 [Lachnospiraceae bacterium]|nr:hypothetical protein [Lachnospiraceae bacterium]